MNASDRLAHKINLEDQRIFEQRRERAEQARKTAEETLGRRASPSELIHKATATELPEAKTNARDRAGGLVFKTCEEARVAEVKPCEVARTDDPVLDDDDDAGVLPSLTADAG